MTLCAGSFHDVVRSPECIAAWSALVNRPLSFEEFEAMPMPHGYAAEDLWRDFAVLRRCSGITFHIGPWFHCEEDVSWASVTQETVRELDEIAQLSSAGSLLNERLKEPATMVGLLPFVADEVSATCHRDGFELSSEDALAFLLRQKKPNTPEERAVSNLVGVYNAIDAYAARPFSLALLDRLHEDLLEGTSGLEHLRQRLIYDESVLWTQRLEDRDFVNRTVYDAIMHASLSGPILDCTKSFYEISASLWDLKYYSCLNGLTELALRWVFFAKAGRPALSIVPFTALSRKRRNRYDRRFTDEFKLLSTRVGFESGLDCTLMFAGTVSTLLAGLREIDRVAGSLAGQMETSLEAIKSSEVLNWRQRDFLVMLKRNPTLTFKVKDYAEMFGVVRVTARADLFALVDAGYLNVRTVERAAVFSLRSSEAE